VQAQSEIKTHGVTRARTEGRSPIQVYVKFDAFLQSASTPEES
jgi:hypothetical protein